MTGARFTYGRIDPETGNIASIGSIERVSRFLDTTIMLEDGDQIPIEDRAEHIIFDEFDGDETDIELVIACASNYNSFKGWNIEDIGSLLRATKHVERQTRHKMNPNCPAYGRRVDLVKAEILTDILPESE